MFESIDPRRHVLGISKFSVRKVVFANAACTIESEQVSRKTAVDDTFTTQTGHICNAREGRTVFADARVGRKWKRATTTFKSTRNKPIS